MSKILTYLSSYANDVLPVVVGTPKNSISVLSTTGGRVLIL